MTIVVLLAILEAILEVGTYFIISFCQVTTFVLLTKNIKTGRKTNIDLLFRIFTNEYKIRKWLTREFSSFQFDNNLSVKRSLDLINKIKNLFPSVTIAVALIMLEEFLASKYVPTNIK